MVSISSAVAIHFVVALCALEKGKEKSIQQAHSTT